MTESNPGQPPPRALHGWVATVDLVLAPIAALLVVLELIGGAAGVSHYLSTTGLSSKRRRWSTAYFVVVGIVDPLAVSLIWFDLLGTGMSRRSRVALIGYVGTAIGGLAALMLLPY